MYQLKNLINRTLPSDPKDNMNSCEDFLLLLLHTHAVAAAKVIQNFNPQDSASELANAIFVNFIDLPSTSSGKDDVTTSEDGVFTYAMELLTLSLLWHGFHDAIREGDGERIIRYWKFLFIIFKSSSYHNYAKEAVTLLLQYYYIFTPRQRSQLLWSRCVNTRGVPGANIPCDLHMEHLNRRLKIVIKNLGANVNPKLIQKAGKTIGVVLHICKIFEGQTSHFNISDSHPHPSFGKDFNSVLNVLEEESVFVTGCKRQHSTFGLR